MEFAETFQHSIPENCGRCGVLITCSRSVSLITSPMIFSTVLTLDGSLGKMTTALVTVLSNGMEIQILVSRKATKSFVISAHQGACMNAACWVAALEREQTSSQIPHDTLHLSKGFLPQYNAEPTAYRVGIYSPNISRDAKRAEHLWRRLCDLKGANTNGDWRPHGSSKRTTPSHKGQEWYTERTSPSHRSRPR